MAGDIKKCSSLILKAKGYATYWDNDKRKILGICKVGAPPFTTIEDVLYVEGLKHNLISISQLCDNSPRKRRQKLDDFLTSVSIMFQ